MMERIGPARPVPLSSLAVLVQATLLVIQGVDQGARFELTAGTVSLGRGVRNEVRIHDTEVSRQHAVFHLEEGRYVVIDRGSSNGTFVNGKVVPRQELRSGDQIQVGRTVLLFDRPVSEDESQRLLDHVDIVGHHDVADRSNIVGEISQESGLLESSFVGTDDEGALSNLQALYRIIDEAVRPSISLEQLLKHILELTIRVVGADRGCMLIADAETGHVKPQVYIHGQGEPTSRMPVSRSIVDYVLKHQQSVQTSDAGRDQRFDPSQSIVAAGIREALCVPMQGRYQILGVIYVDTTRSSDDETDEHRFQEDQLRLLAAVGRQAALAMENNRYQQALVKSERLAAVGQTITMLSHHIKNILQGVRGGSYLIDTGLKDDNGEFIRKGWRIVEKNQARIYHLVMDMLSFSKERQPVLRPADVNETVGEVCELMFSRAEECNVELTWQPGEEIPEGTFDPEGIHRAVLNVVINAIDATEGLEGAAVEVQTGHDAEADMLVVAVSDNGPGIADEQMDKIFNVFESTKGARGTGLGLAVSRKIIQEHGGEVAVESEPGKGCRFVLSWPRTDEEHRHSETQTEV